MVLLVGCWNQDANQFPQAVMALDPTEGYAPLEVTFDASGSHDPDGEIVAYIWDFGDGQEGEGVVVTHIYQDDGRYMVRLTVRDDKGATDIVTGQVKVLNPPPTASFTYFPESPRAGETVTFDATASTDPASLRAKEVVEYHWNFGDGSEGSGAVVEHTYLVPGEYTVVLTVTDDDGDSATAQAQLTVGPPEPPPPPGG